MNLKINKFELNKFFPIFLSNQDPFIPPEAAAPQNRYLEKNFKSHSKTTALEFFFSKDIACNLTKNGLHRNFFRVNSVKFSRPAFF